MSPQFLGPVGTREGSGQRGCGLARWAVTRTRATGGGTKSESPHCPQSKGTQTKRRAKGPGILQTPARQQQLQSQQVGVRGSMRPAGIHRTPSHSSRFRGRRGAETPCPSGAGPVASSAHRDSGPGGRLHSHIRPQVPPKVFPPRAWPTGAHLQLLAPLGGSWSERSGDHPGGCASPRKGGPEPQARSLWQAAARPAAGTPGGTRLPATPSPCRNPTVGT